MLRCVRGRRRGEAVPARTARRWGAQALPAALADAFEGGVKSVGVGGVGRAVHAADVLGEEVFAVEVVVAHAGFFHLAAFGCGGSGG